MYCPGCGKENSTDQSFCRFCGFGLEKVSQLVLEETESQLGADARLKSSQRIMEKVGSIGSLVFIGGGVVFLGILIYTIVSKFIVAKGEILPGIALLLLLIGAVLLLSYVVFMESQKDSAKRKRRLAAIARAQTTGNLRLEPPPEMISSVTEQTTELLRAGEAKDEQER